MVAGSPSFARSYDELLTEARTRTGLDDFGPDDFREGYTRLLDELDEAGLSDGGRIATRETIIAHLCGRLRAIDGFKRHSNTIGGAIRRPLVVIGIVRSGTTALHKLLSMDPQFQGPENWLCAAPQPRPPRSEWASNSDFQQVKAQLEAAFEVAPEMLEDHGMAADTVEESLNLLAQSFCSNMFPSQFRIPRYDAWYRAQDDTFAYEYFAKVLKLIGNGDPRTWLVKNPTDTYSLRQVLNVFPDAMVVQTHRDPLQAIPSIVNLLAGAHRMFRGDGPMDEVFAREQEFWALAMERADAVKAAIPGQYIDIDFRNFVSDQMGVIDRIYDHFGLTLSAQAEDAMRGWLDANPRKSKTMQRFTPEDWGGSTGALVERYRSYRERYGYA